MLLGRAFARIPSRFSSFHSFCDPLRLAEQACFSLHSPQGDRHVVFPVRFYLCRLLQDDLPRAFHLWNLLPAFFPVCFPPYPPSCFPALPRSCLPFFLSDPRSWLPRFFPRPFLWVSPPSALAILFRSW